MCTPQSALPSLRMRRFLPSLTTLQAFEAAARHVSFSRAATELALTPSAISRHIAALEQQLGVALFVRHRQHLSLSVSGQDYALRVRQRLADLERDTQEVCAGREFGYELRLAVVPTFCEHWLIARLPHFYAQQPKIRLHLAVRTEPFALAQSSFDAALYYGDKLWPHTHGQAFLAEGDCIAVAAPALIARHPQLLDTPASWIDCPHLSLSSRPHAWRDWYRNGGWPFCVQASRSCHYELYSLLLAAVRAALGVALLPRWLAQVGIEQGDVVQVHSTPLCGGAGAYWLAHPAARTPGAAFVAFQAWLLTQRSCQGGAVPPNQPPS